MQFLGLSLYQPRPNFSSLCGPCVALLFSPRQTLLKGAVSSAAWQGFTMVQCSLGSLWRPSPAQKGHCGSGQFTASRLGLGGGHSSPGPWLILWQGRNSEGPLGTGSASEHAVYWKSLSFVFLFLTAAKLTQSAEVVSTKSCVSTSHFLITLNLQDLGHHTREGKGNTFTIANLNFIIFF